ncbi:MAG TPA: C25 family cysteine peptidase [Phycisphaerae bacterium]|nr:C25 family cysteine peptidase [Phycisphaerae bacterium]HNU43964.1 C25 family cysteine peptidase [Phycisphaerae bacterium]
MIGRTSKRLAGLGVPAALLLAVVVLAAGVEAATGSEVVRVVIPGGSYEVTGAPDAQQLRIEGFGHPAVPGEPKLPTRIFAVAVPPGAQVTDVRFEPGEGMTLPGVYRIVPTPLARVIGEENPELYARDQARYEATRAAVYGSDEAYPAQVGQFVRTAGYRKYNLVDVQITPFQYQPLSGTLTYYPEVTVEVTYELPARAEVMVDQHPATEAIAREIVLNCDEAAAWYSQQAPDGRDQYDFVIVTLDALVFAVQPLVDWETLKGRSVQVVTTTWIYANYTGYDSAEKIRNFLRDKYPSGQWGIQDVLIVGNKAEVPMRETYQDLGYGRPDTDFYFAELSLPDSQSWDADVDRKWGEDTDPIDFYNEVNVGRIPWSDAATVLSICNKSVAFEQNNDPGFKRNILLLGGYFWADTDNAVLMEAKVNQFWMADWTMTRMYEKNSDYWSSYPCDYPLLHSNVMSVWPNNTYAFVNWAGHGSPTSCHIYGLGAPAFIESGDCPSLNDGAPAIIFADACSNSDTHYVNIGQAMLQRGAVGFVGATRVALGCPGWDHPDDGSSQSLDYRFTTFVTSGNYSQGAALQRGLRQMYTQNLWDYLRYETFQWGALWGNPDLSLSYNPVLSISFPDGRPEMIAPGTPTAITVRIVEGQESYIPGSGTFYYRVTDGAFQSTPLEHVAGNLYRAVLPGARCAFAPQYYFSAEGSESGVIFQPPGAPATTFSAEVGEYATVHSNTFTSNPGWTTQGAWAFGQPTGGGGQYGYPDPTSGYTGPYVYGYNLSGDYPNNMSEYHLTSTAFNCSGLERMRLRFMRWLGVEQPLYDHAYIRISTNGSTWTTIWSNPTEITDNSWVPVEYDISAVADNQATVYLRWTMGTSDGGWTYCGWNIDDVELTAFVCEDPIPGDSDGDGDVDRDDYANFAGCLTGPYGGVPSGCDWANLDGDADVDLADVAAFQAAFTGQPM